MPDTAPIDTTAQSLIHQTILRAENLIEDRKAVVADLSELFKEAKAHGLDVKALKQAIKFRAEDKAARAELDAMTDLYLSACGE